VGGRHRQRPGLGDHARTALSIALIASAVATLLIAILQSSPVPVDPVRRELPPTTRLPAATSPRLPATTLPPRTETVTAWPTTTTPPPPPTPTPPPAPAVEIACDNTGFGGVKPHVARVGHHLAVRFGLKLTSILGVGSRENQSDHPLGLAIDVLTSKTSGDAIAQYVLDRRSLFAITYVIWRQRINYGSGWELMEDRGSPTANHYDHVHISFKPTGSGGSVTC
jgi:hypothetical protein